MKINLKIAFLIFTCVAFAGCSLFEEQIEPAGVPTTKTYDLNGINGISISDRLEVELYQSSENKIELITDENYLPYLNFVGDGNTFKIYKNGEISFADSDLIIIKVFVDSLSNLEISGGSKLIADNIASSSLNLELFGGSELEAQITSVQTNILLSGGSEAEIKGVSKTLEMELNGGSTLYAEDFVCDNVKGILTGGSDGEISVSDTLDIEANGGSSLEYDGEPRNVVQSVNGGAKVEQK